MASSPPFDLEETDEDFFDKLVDDDFRVSEHVPSIATTNAAIDDVESEEFKLLSKLSISEVSGDLTVVSLVSDPPEKDILVSQESVSLVSPSSFDLDITAAVKNTNVLSESEAGKNSGFKSSNVKEVQWSSFYADSAQQSSNGFGSYSDFLTEFGDNSVDPFEELLDNHSKIEPDIKHSITDNGVTDFTDQELNNENLYPGWAYDAVTGQWRQVECNDEPEVVYNQWTTTAGDGELTGQNSEVSYLQNNGQSGVMESLAQEDCPCGGVSIWYKSPQVSTEYPPHMFFDPQYPGWYYDMIAHEWLTLESYTPVVQSTNRNYHDQDTQNKNVSMSNHHADHDIFGDGKAGNYQLQGRVDVGLSTTSIKNTWEHKQDTKSDAIVGFTEIQQPQNFYGPIAPLNNYGDQQTGFKLIRADSLHDNTGHNIGSNSGANGFQKIDPSYNFPTQFNQTKLEESQRITSSHDYYGSQNLINYPHQPLPTVTQMSFNSNEGRSSAGRPPHALVTFGFGGKLIVMKEGSSSVTSTSYGSQDCTGSSISVFSLMDIVAGKNDATNSGGGDSDYFNTLCFQFFPGPLIGGSVGSKELNKWIDRRIKNYESPNIMLGDRGVLTRLLLSLLKIASQYNGKLRSPFGSDQSLKRTGSWCGWQTIFGWEFGVSENKDSATKFGKPEESECPESAVARLFASAKRNGTSLARSGVVTPYVHNMHSDVQIRAAAVEVQNLLVSGKAKEALQCAQEGQLWGPALILAAQLGDQFYVETVKQMVQRQLVAGSPLRTLCLLVAGKSEDVFSAETLSTSGHPDTVNIFPHLPKDFSDHAVMLCIYLVKNIVMALPVRAQSNVFLADPLGYLVAISVQAMEGSYHSSLFFMPFPEIGANRMLDDWEENLAIITANRTKDDQLVIVHLGDCLWKERDEATAAQMCYLIAEANFESFSGNARLCLIGADHWKFPRTYASPEAIQRTEFYEYTNVLGNSQFILLPFLPYKIIYAHMLVEVGKVSDSLKYCQAIMKSLKSGRSPEMEAWKLLVSSLEERIKNHQQGGFSTNMDPVKVVGKLIPFIDRSIHRIIGPSPPPAPSLQGDNHPVVSGVTNSQSTIAMSSLLPSASTDPISQWMDDSNKIGISNRSVSEPDFGRTPRQAKLGDKNTFYYDEKLKRWIEEGAEPPPDETAPPPPPTTAAFQNGMSPYSSKRAFKNESSFANGSSEVKSLTPPEHSSGIPPIPPNSNHFSAHGRMGVRSRYVDTFNKGGGTPSNLIQSPALTSVKPEGGSSNAKFFVPSAATIVSETVAETTEENDMHESSATNDYHSYSSFSSSAMQQFPDMNHVRPTLNNGVGVADNGNGSVGSHPRKTASWSGRSDNFISNPYNSDEIKSFREPSSFMPGSPSSVHLPMNAESLEDDLHEVEL
ncbi:hypothetical protein GIB67_036497 [Kingdonia uniflora]|uniref:Protein transport protein sec16 n=1 Tax=Kingdonia uniflora TaxID=39325 RepID=A0A7J7P7J9_9MAGN|nr:hypothetical protein GIB67_036497 [Kingdonia uniflora]